MALGASHDQAGSGHDTRNSAGRYECSKVLAQAPNAAASAAVVPAAPSLSYALLIGFSFIHCCLLLHHQSFAYFARHRHTRFVQHSVYNASHTSPYHLRLPASGRSHWTAHPKSWKLRPPPRRFSPPTSQGLRSEARSVAWKSTAIGHIVYCSHAAKLTHALCPRWLRTTRRCSGHPTRRHAETTGRRHWRDHQYISLAYLQHRYDIHRSHEHIPNNDINIE